MPKEIKAMSSKAKPSELSLSHQPDQPVSDRGMIPEQTPESKLASYKREILSHHRQCVGSARATIKQQVACGEAAAAARDLLRGSFLRWVDKNFSATTGFGRRTAQRYIRSFEAYKEFLAAEGTLDELISNATALSSHQLLDAYADHVLSDRMANGKVRRALKVRPNDWEAAQPVIDAVRGVLGHIECDPCAPSSSHAPPLAEIRYSENENGLAAENSWPGTAWVAPGHKGECAQWAIKALEELKNGSLREAIVCLSADTADIPEELFSYPMAMTNRPMTVGYRVDEAVISCDLPTRSLFFYLSHHPDLGRFASAFSKFAVAFAPIGSGGSTLTVIES